MESDCKAVALFWNQTIRYSRDSHENPNVLWGWVDADWAGDTDTRRSTRDIFS